MYFKLNVVNTGNLFSLMCEDIKKLELVSLACKFHCLILKGRNLLAKQRDGNNRPVSDKK